MPTVEKAASEYTDYIKKRATVVGRREFSDSLFNSLVLQSSVGRGLGNTPEGPIPSGGDYGVLTGFNLNNKVLWYPSFGDLGDFTVELFFKCSDVNEQCLWCFSDSIELGMGIDNGILELFCFDGNDNYDASITSVTPDTWYHVALTRNGTNWYASINGTTFEVTLGSPVLTGSLCIGNFYPTDVDEFYSGSISNFRISTPKYSTGTYTIPSVPLSASGAKLLLLAKQDAPFADSAGKYVSEYQCEWVPGPIPSIPQPRTDYGVLTGFNRDSVMTYPGFGISGDFTMECFFKSNDPASAVYEPICFFEDDGSSPYIGIVLDEGFIYIDISETEDRVPISQIEANTWYHVALTRSGTDFYTSINGQTSLNTDTIDTDISNVDFYVGWYGNTLNYVDDYFSISNLRISNFARYTEDYTLPTVPMEPATTDLLLLLAKPSAPFADTALPSRTPKVSTTTCGWAPGPIESPTTDYGVLTGFNTSRSITYSTFGDLGTNFTVELFFKISDTNTYQILWEIGGTGGTVGMYIESGEVYARYGNPDYLVDDPIIFYPGTNTWYHVAVTQEGSNWYTSVNGNTQGWDIPNITISNAELEIGVTDDNNNPLESGSISNFRISSVAKYTDTDGYTLPIIPMQASATDLLLLLAKPDAPFADTVLSPRTPKEPTNTCKWGPGPIVAPITEYGLLTGFVDSPMYYSSIGVMPSTFTIEFFFKYNEIESSPYLFVIGIPTETNFSDYFSVYVNNTTHRVEFDSNFDYQANLREIGETNSNTWYHFALTRDGSVWYPSINGSTEVWDITNTSSLDGVNLGLTIGRDRVGNKLNGSISNFRISNVAKYKTLGSYVVPSVPIKPASTDLLLLLAKPGEPFVDSSSFDRTPTETCEWAPGEPIVV